jgi:putative oxidoreductase
MLLSSEPVQSDVGLLALRLSAGITMFWQHGLPKLMNFADRMDTFNDPFGISPLLALTLIVIAEAGCSLLVVLGLWTRLSTIPLIIGMAVIVFMAKAGDPFKEKELALIYLMAFLTIFFAGSGRYSLDRLKFQ